MSSIRMFCVDHDGVQVCLTESRWYAHILRRHSYLEGQEQHVKRAVEHPELMTQDRGYPRRKCFYRRVMLPNETDDEYLKVVVQYDENDRDEVEGWIVTAFAVRSIQEDEDRLWPIER